ncbi:hypothetical protein LguiA_028160 [Lonicera macranthoides]
MGERLGVRLGVSEEVMIKSCSMSMEAYTSSKKKPYVYHKVKGSPEVALFAFDGLRTVEDWKPFENTKIDRILFPSIRSIGTDDVAMVNKAFVLRFKAILDRPKFVDKVEKAMKENQIVFAGHSSGGGVAILITLWFFEKYIRTGIYHKPPHCITFGSPLIGDRIISHALRRENWADNFVHFVTRYDIVPRIMLSPLSTIEEMLKFILSFKKELIHEESNEASELFKTVMKNALYVASHSACKLMGGGTDPLSENVLAFVPLSPYRPFGTYIFSTGNGKLAVVKNPDAVLQMLFYCAQPTSEEKCAQVACSSLNEHMHYESELKSSISQMQDVVYLDHPEEVPLSSNGSASHDAAGTNTVLTDFGLSAHARICLRAAGEFEKRKVENEYKIDSEIGSIREGLVKIGKYKSRCNVTYYDSFKCQEYEEDFNINILRLNLAGIWDELIEMLKRSELPDRFEGRKDWIELGTEYRRLVEPLDIGNYYRHQKYKETGPYMGKENWPRPKRYRFTQRWREHDLKLAVDSSSESCFLAHVEQLIVRASKESFEAMKEDILKVEREVSEWVRDEELGEEVFVEGSTFSEWWKKLPHHHRLDSRLAPNFLNKFEERQRELITIIIKMGERLGERLEIREEVIIKACSMSMEAHKSVKGKQYVHDKVKGSPEVVVVFAFGGLPTVEDWKPFGETKIDRSMFPSIRSIGTDDVAMVNKAFLLRFEAMLKQPKFVEEVQRAMKEKNQIVFAGHSSGGGVAILITLWFLEKYTRTGNYPKPPHCITFGSPLVGDRIISHALRRENWAHYFIHFVTRYDIVPRIMLTPLSSIEKKLEFILPFKKKPLQISEESSDLFKTVMKNASYVASHSACNLMGCTNPLLENVLAFVPLSPYRPFGTYIFSTGNGRLAVLTNPDAVLQMLFYCAQLSSEEECAEVACRSLNEHMTYESELKSSIEEMQDVVYLDCPEYLPLSSNGNASLDVAGTNTILTDFGLSAHARVCLRAAGELEKQKQENQKKMDSKKDTIRQVLARIEEYKRWWETRGVTHYDAFKLQKERRDFEANVARLELAGIWDELIEMLKRYELPDGFEGMEGWIELGTEFRRLVEPLDIANYYRHLKNEDTGPYLGRPRPKRYRFTQRWREHDLQMPVDSSWESCFLAKVEELRTSKESFEKLKEDILKVEKKVFEWVSRGELGNGVFLQGSTFSEWWKKLPEHHRLDIGNLPRKWYSPSTPRRFGAFSIITSMLSNMEAVKSTQLKQLQHNYVSE